jgi:hypothetical protein
MHLFGYDFNIKKKVPATGIVIPEEVEGNFTQYMEEMKKNTGKTDIEILKETFDNSWMSLSVEETGANLKLDSEALHGNKSGNEKKDIIEDCIRLRHKFAPITTCVNYVQQQLIGGGIEAIVQDAKNKVQEDMKEDIDEFIDKVYQDSIITGLNIMLPILIDYSLTTGVGAAEIAYFKNVSFWDYAKIKEPETVTIEGKSVDILKFDIKEPEWNKLKGIKRLKIFPTGYKLFEPQRNEKSIEIEYWNVDDKDANAIHLSDGSKVRKYNPSNPQSGLYLHNWQLFYLGINRPEFGAKGESIIVPAYSTAIILEKIIGAVGEGIHRSGYKRFFLIMGTEKRPWGGPFIRNVLKQMKEAREKNWSTIPMPQGFDIKEMGGEVFDAKEVVEYLLKMIAKTMNCPSSILGISMGSGSTEESYSYSIWRNNIISAIRNQLFKRHIWAMHGQKKSKQGGSSEDSYIPIPRIKLEELLSMKERLDLFKTIMNFANPLDPVTKRKAEMEYCKYMGWMDVIKLFPTLEEYNKELVDAKKKMEKQADEQAANAKKLANAPKAPDMSNPLGQKMQGQPKAPSEEQLAKRQAGGVNVRKADSKKGKIVSKTVQETEIEDVEDSFEEFEETVNEPQKVEITVKTESHPQQINIKTESTPQKIELTQQPIEINVKQDSVLSDAFHPMGEVFTNLAKENAKNIKIKVDKEQEKMDEEIKVLQSETKKNEVETEEIKKTQEQKRKIMEKIEKEVS